MKKKENKQEDYHSNYGYISNSSLKLLSRPLEFYNYLVGAYEREDTSYLKFGTIFHMYVLERSLFEKNVKVMNYESPKSPQQKQFCSEYIEAKGNVSERLLKAYKAAYATKEAEEKILDKAKSLRRVYDGYLKYLKASRTKTVISTKEMNKIEAMWQALYRHKAAFKLVCQSYGPVDDEVVHNEKAFYWNKENISFKALLDRIIVNETQKSIKLIDLKTTANLAHFRGDFERYGYGIQLAFYSLALLNAGEKVLKLQHPIDEYTLEVLEVVVDKATEEVKVFKLSETELLKASQELKELIDRASWHINNDKWAYSREYYEGDGTEEL